MDNENNNGQQQNQNNGQQPPNQNTEQQTPRRPAVSDPNLMYTLKKAHESGPEQKTIEEVQKGTIERK